MNTNSSSENFFARHFVCLYRSSHQRLSIKTVFLKISQNLQENTCASASFFNNVAGLRSATLLKKRLWHRCFPVNFAKFLGTPFLQKASGRLLLSLIFNF